MATIDLPEDDKVVGDAGHTTDHNEIVIAVNAVNAESAATAAGLESTNASLGLVAEGLTLHVADATDAHPASAISTSGHTGNISGATTVQAALGLIDDLSLGGGGGGAASTVSYNPTGNDWVTGSNVQAALDAADVAIETVSSTAGGAAVDLAAHTGDATDAHDASAISVVPTGLSVITTTNVQAALAELDAASGGGGGGGNAHTSGSGAPTGGSDGDTYERTDPPMLWYKKVGGAWVAMGPSDTYIANYPALRASPWVLSGRYATLNETTAAEMFNTTLSGVTRTGAGAFTASSANATARYGKGARGISAVFTIATMPVTDALRFGCGFDFEYIGPPYWGGLILVTNTGAMSVTVGGALVKTFSTTVVAGAKITIVWVNGVYTVNLINAGATLVTEGYSFVLDELGPQQLTDYFTGVALGGNGSINGVKVRVLL